MPETVPLPVVMPLSGCSPDLPSTTPVAGLERYRARAGEYLLRSRAENTQRGYASDWRDFEAFCRLTGHTLLEQSDTAGVYRFIIQHTAAA